MKSINLNNLGLAFVAVLIIGFMAGCGDDGGKVSSPSGNTPIAENMSISTQEDTYHDFILTSSGSDHDILTYHIDTQPEHGTLWQIEGENWRYLADEDYNGQDSLMFYVNDGNNDSNTATVNITVEAVNDRPEAEHMVVATPDQVQIDIVLLASDVDGDTLTYHIHTQPEHGTLVQVEGKNLTYAPDVGYTGDDSFEYYVDDGILDSSKGIVVICVGHYYGDHNGPYGENDGIHGGLHHASGGPPMDPRIKGWATSVVDYWRPEGTTFGTPDIVLGPPGGTFHVLSIGDGGWIIVTFDQIIANGDGPDFAVWENGFISHTAGYQVGMLWAEFMYVEVSSNGIDFVRFPSVNLIPGPVDGFGCIDPTYVHNVAGKHPNGNDQRDEGTPFDLEDLVDDPLVLDGTVDLNNIQYVKVIDVIGDGSTFDSLDNPMWDPFPTPFSSCGADLDSIAVLNTP